MAKFLDTTGVSYHLQQLINRANEKLVLISPYLKINDRIKQSLEDKNRLKIDIRIVYGKNELQPQENNWIKSMQSIRTSFCKDLHAKCYLNEKEAIITSMNLYEFSQVNNNEMGIYLERDKDAELYRDLAEEAQRLIRISEELVTTVEKKETKTSEIGVLSIEPGFCIRTGVKIPFNIEKPMTMESYKKWSMYSDKEYPEKFCHYSGEQSDGETTFKQPILRKYWKKAKEQYGL
jgi:phosphatidylserine/phosphatidylglycerophosphate/cardiolipin synthase-like enzyme